MRISANDQIPGQGGVSTRRNLDKRSARLRYSRDFVTEITKCNDAALFKPKAAGVGAAHLPVKIYIRKRPIFPEEKQRGDFDVITTDESSATLVLHRTGMTADMLNIELENITFDGFHSVFGSQADSTVVYEQSFQPAVERVLTRESPTATLLFFGQTGSGKTYTMTACQELLAQQIFSSERLTHVEVQSVELAGKTCRDLMGVSTAPNTVKIFEEADGSVHFKDAQMATVKSAADLLDVLSAVKSRRATESTFQNSESSRSHAIYKLWYYTESSDKACGAFTLVDCAGSERRNDSLYHSKERQVESSEINSSIFDLKTCIRARISGAEHVPYRSHPLTKVLRQSIEDDKSSLVVIATVAPNATDTEHTLETLRTVESWIGPQDTSAETKKSLRVQTNHNNSTVSCDRMVPKSPKQWDYDELVEWLNTKHMLAKDIAVPKRLNGRAIMRMSEIQIRSCFFRDDENRDRASRLYRSLREESNRIDQMNLQRRLSKKAALSKD